MTDPFTLADDLGPEKVIHCYDPATGLKAILVVDNVAVGPAIGGCRMAPDVTVEECARLARAMTLKNAAAGLPHGGGKSVVMADPSMPAAEKERLMRSFAYAIRDIDDYIIGPDMGTNETTMAWCRDVIGRAVGLPREIGGIPLDEIGATGLGLCASIESASEVRGFTLSGARVVVQGFGSVGMHAARYLAEKGAVLVGASDSRGAIAGADGLDLSALIELKGQGGSVADLEGGQVIDADALLRLDCDIWIPAARPDVIRADNAAEMRTRLVAQGANIPATAEAEAILEERGVIVLPDFIANAGGVICASVEYHGGQESDALRVIREKIGDNTRAMLERAEREGLSSRAAAMAISLERVRQAMAYRRTA
jgi:glutamate dehydrogenase/leucine dehydrogenase